MSEEVKPNSFIRLDTGKFKTHASTPGLIANLSITCWNFSKNRLENLVSLDVIFTLFETFKQIPLQEHLLELIFEYVRYVKVLDFDKKQLLNNSLFDSSIEGSNELFSILYYHHTIVTQKGAEKYPMGNWLKMEPKEVVRCLEPLERHMIYYPIVKGELVDSENSLHHVQPTIWNLIAIYRVFLIDEITCRKAILGELK